MARRTFTRLLASSKPRRRRGQNALAPESLSAQLGSRVLRIEEVERRLMLTHAAPLLNSADTAAFAALPENTPISGNVGEMVSTLLASGGPIVDDQPLGNNFLSLDTANGAQQGIAVAALGGQADGAWQYSTNGGTSWSLFTGTVSAANAERLASDSRLRFLPNEGFSGSISLQFAAWDETDGGAAGSHVDLTVPGATGGTTAYSTATANATLAVTPAQTPSFTLGSASTLEDNTVAASGGSPGGSNPNLISVPNFANNIVLGDGGANSVSFTVTDAGGNFNTLFSQLPSIDSQGTLTYQLKPDVYGVARLSVTASNGLLTSAAQQTTITVTDINDPPTLNPISNPAWVQDTAGQQSVSLTGITAGLNETQNLTVTAAAAPQGSDNVSLLAGSPTISYTSPNSTGTLYYTPQAGQFGTLHITVTVTDDGGTANGGVNSFSQTFVVTVNAPPTYALNPTTTLENNTVAASGGLAGGSNPNVISVTGFASGISTGLAQAGSVSFTVTDAGGNFNMLFSQLPSIDSQGTLTYQLKPDVYGVATLSVTANNGLLTSTAQQTTITVTDINDPPTLSPIANPAWVQDTAGQQSVSLGGISAGLNETQNLTVTAVAAAQGSDNPSLLSASPTVTYTSPGTTGTLHYTPQPGQFGTLHITVTVADDGGTANGGVNSFSQTFVVTVNAPPKYTLNPTTTLENNTVVASGGSAGGSNPNVISVVGFASGISTGLAQAGSVSFTVTDAGGNFNTLFSQLPSIDSQGTLTYQLKPDVYGVARLSVTASNGLLTSAAQQTTITVTDINDPPTLAPISNPAWVQDTAGQQSVSLGGISAGLNETQNLTVTAVGAAQGSDNPSLLSGSPTVTYTSPGTTGTLHYTPQPGQFGTLHITVTVTDDGGTANGGVNSFSQTFVVTVNAPPTYTLNPTTTLENNTVVASGGSAGGSNPNVISVAGFASGISTGLAQAGSVSFTVTDAGGNFSTLFSQLPSIDSQGTLTYQLKPDVYGVARLSVTANNGLLTSAAQQTTITVTDINDPPTLDSISNPAWVRDTAGQQQITLTGITAGLNETQNLTVTATATPRPGDNPNLLGGLFVVYGNPSTTGTLDWDPMGNQNGTLQVTVTVQDDGGTANGGQNTTTRTFVVTVYQSPTFAMSAGPVQVAENSGAYSAANWATPISPGTPDNNDPMSFAVTNTNSGLFSVQPSINSSGTLTFTPQANQYGSATVSVYLINGFDGLNSSTQTFTIKVFAPPTASPDTYVVYPTGRSVASLAQSVFVNDSDPNASPFLEANVVSNTSNGSLTFANGGGSFSYLPGANFKGVDRFSYQPYDGPAYGNTVTVTLYSHGGAMVSKLYQEMLGRAASDSDIGYWAPGLDNNSYGITTVQQGIYTSAEYLNPKVTWMYQHYLGQNPDPGGESYWEGIWTSNGGPEQVIIGIATTSTCYSYSGGTNTSWVTLLYWNILNRAPDSNGLNYFVNGLSNNSMTRQQVVQTLVDGNEYRGDVIQNFFQTFLGRSANTTELTNYENMMSSGTSQMGIQQTIVSSAEYTGNPPAPAAGSVYKWV